MYASTVRYIKSTDGVPLIIVIVISLVGLLLYLTSPEPVSEAKTTEIEHQLAEARPGDLIIARNSHSLCPMVAEEQKKHLSPPRIRVRFPAGNCIEPWDSSIVWYSSIVQLVGDDGVLHVIPSAQAETWFTGLDDLAERLAR